MPPKPQAIRSIRQNRGKLLNNASGSLLVEKLNELPVVDLEVTPLPDHTTARALVAWPAVIRAGSSPSAKHDTNTATGKWCCSLRKTNEAQLVARRPQRRALVGLLEGLLCAVVEKGHPGRKNTHAQALRRRPQSFLAGDRRNRALYKGRCNSPPGRVGLSAPRGFRGL